MGRPAAGPVVVCRMLVPRLGPWCQLCLRLTGRVRERPAFLRDTNGAAASRSVLSACERCARPSSPPVTTAAKAPSLTAAIRKTTPTSTPTVVKEL